MTTNPPGDQPAQPAQPDRPDRPEQPARPEQPERPERLVAGRYLLGERLGRGGMGIVWRARDQLLDREVAVKELHVGALPQEALATLHARMKQEARAAARIGHPNVITIHDVLDHDGRPWIVMELVDGRSLAEIITTEGTLLPRDAARIGAQILSALAQGHRLGVLHRDVKPANVLIDRQDRVVLTDFGIAVFEGAGGLTRTGEIVGSPDYLAPERVTGHRPGPESDLWALGATLYAALEGQSPFQRSSTIGTLQAVITDPLPVPRNAGPLFPVIAALLRKDPAERATADQALRMLQDVAQGRTTATEPIPGPRDARLAAPPPPPYPPAYPPLPGPGAGYPPPAGYGPGPGCSPGPGYGPGTGPTRVDPVPGPARRRRAWLLLGAAALAAALAGGTTAVLVADAHPPRPDAAATATASTAAPSPTPTPSSSSAPTTGPATAPRSTVPAGASLPAPPAAPPAPTTTPAADPASTVTAYYAAINAHDYRTAWNLGGRNLGGSYSAFAAGFADTSSDTLTIDSVSGPSVAVHLHAVHTDGSTADYAGTYTVAAGVITQGSLQPA
ncbi:serine/threonine-protein kinase [Streptacidiphilus sp. MAP12-16]|uniref:serine/threonine-protein kinase n=1 Tax=Streptacidiphilus sp. MAP12-16 TaxID=3156300 RepID=UPI003510F891